MNYMKAFDCVDHNKLKKILKKMGITDHLTCLLRKLYAGDVPAPKHKTYSYRITRALPGHYQQPGITRSLGGFLLITACDQ